MEKISNGEIKNMFEGKILPVTLRLAIPISISNFLAFLYFVIDTYFISLIDKSSTALLSGIALVFPIFFLFISLGIGLTVGISTLIARGIGEKNNDAIDKTADSGLLTSSIIAVFILIFGYIYGDQIVHFLAGSKLSEEAIRNGLNYYYYLLPGLGMMLYAYVFFGILQGEGLMKNIAIASIIAFMLNIILDPILIFTFQMGVSGAALATTISYAVGGIYVIQILLRGKSSVPISWNLFRARKKIIKEILRIGLPESLSTLSMSITFMFLNNLVSSIGEGAMNSWALCGRTDQILVIPALAVSASTITMLGQNYGRNNLGRVVDIYKSNILYGILAVVFLAIIYNLSARPLFSALSSVSEVVDGAILQVRFLSFTFIGISTAMISAAAFQATGRPLPAMFIRLIQMGILIIPMAYFFVNVFNMGMIGIFYSLGAGNIIILFLSWIWTNHHLKNLKYRDVV